MPGPAFMPLLIPELAPVDVPVDVPVPVVRVEDVPVERMSASTVA